MQPQPLPLQPNDAAAQYKLALAHSYLAEIAIEQRDKNLAHSAAEAGIKVAERTVALKPDFGVARYYLGVVLLQQARFDEADESFEKAAESLPAKHPFREQARRLRSEGIKVTRGRVPAAVILPSNL